MSDKEKKKKKKDKDDKGKGNTLEYQASVSASKASEYLVELGQRILGGGFSVSSGKETVNLAVDGPVMLQLRARASEDAQSLRLELSWEPPTPTEENKELTFGSVSREQDALETDLPAEVSESDADEPAPDGPVQAKKAPRSKKKTRRR